MVLSTHDRVSLNLLMRAGIAVAVFDDAVLLDSNRSRVLARRKDWSSDGLCNCRRHVGLRCGGGIASKNWNRVLYCPESLEVCSCAS